MRAAAGTARRTGSDRDQLGDRRRGIRAGTSACRSCLGHGYPRPVRSRPGAVLLQAMGRADPEGWWPCAGREYLEPDAAPGGAGRLRGPITRSRIRVEGWMVTSWRLA